jgi:hypothetical protein
MAKVRYNLVTRQIEEWGEIIFPQLGMGLIENVAEDMLPYLTIAGSIDPTGKLQIDTVKLAEAKRTPVETQAI